MTGEATAATRAKSPVTHAEGIRPAIQAQLDSNLVAPDATRDADVTVAEEELDQVERAVLVSLADGQSAAEIAAALGMPEEMLGITMANALAKLHRQHAALRDEQAGATRERARADEDGPTARD